MLAKVDALCNMSWALISPSPGSVYEPLVEEISFLENENLIAVGTLRSAQSLQRPEPNDNMQLETEAAANEVGNQCEGNDAQVLLVPPKSPLWERVRKIREQNCLSTIPSEFTGAAKRAAALEIRLREPLQEGDMLMVRVDVCPQQAR